MKALHILSNLSGKTLFLPVLMVMLALTTSLAQAPANDLCSGATPIACGQTLTGSTLSATIDQAPACGLSLPKYGVWYSIAGTGGDITLSTCGGANWDTQIGVYSGSCAALTCVAGNNNFCGRQSTVTFSSVSGTTYYIWVTGVIDARGNFSLSATCANVAPANDLCANAQALKKFGERYLTMKSLDFAQQDLYANVKDPDAIIHALMSSLAQRGSGQIENEGIGADAFFD
ncbi:MAG TPA: hypothetical protein PK198_08195, partial [Saprospiraceae bacterium]|nr:hypothetical protein [Saprospiraceae bacterium]